MPGISFGLGLHSSGFLSSIRAAQASIQGLKGAATSLRSQIGPLMGFAAALGGVRTAADLVSKVLNEAADAESLRKQFEPLLGTVDAVKSRLKSLQTLADQTSLDMPEIAAASRVLEVFTKGALSAGNGLEMIGDVATGTNTGLEETATTIGRLFDALKSGRTAGEPLQRLQEIGALSGDARTEIEKLAAAGKDFPTVWRVATQEFRRYEGALKGQGQTFHGLVSTMRGAWDSLFREAGAPINEAIKPVIKDLTDFFSGLKETAGNVGLEIATWGGTAYKLFKTGELGAVVRDALQIGGMEAVNFLYRSAVASIASIGAGLGSALAVAKDALNSDGFMRGMKASMDSIAHGFMAILQQGVADVLRGVPGMGDAAIGANFRAESSRRASSVSSNVAANAFKNTDVKELGSKIATAFVNTLSTFKDVFNSAQPPFDPEMLRQQKAAVGGKLASTAQRQRDVAISNDGNQTTESQNSARARLLTSDRAAREAGANASGLGGIFAPILRVADQIFKFSIINGVVQAPRKNDGRSRINGVLQEALPIKAAEFKLPKQPGIPSKLGDFQFPPLPDLRGSLSGISGNRSLQEITGTDAEKRPSKHEQETAQATKNIDKGIGTMIGILRESVIRSSERGATF